MPTIEQFAAALPAYKSYCLTLSPATQALKDCTLGLFVEYMSKEHPGQEITKEMILGFRRSLYGMAPNSIAQYMRQVSTAFTFMTEMDLWEGANPVNRHLIGREKYKPYDSLLTDADIQRILRDERPELMTGRVYLRARAMSLLVLTSGLRLSELMALTPEDLDWEQGRATVRHGKGDKWRVVPFHEIAQEAVRTYMERLRKGCPEGMPLFVGTLKKGGFKKLTKRTVEYNIGDFIEGMTGRTDISPHDLRHAMASWLVSSGMNMREVQTLLGHTSIQTTERYASLVAPDTLPVRNANQVMNIAFGRPEPVEQAPV